MIKLDFQEEVDVLIHSDRLIQLQTIWNALYNHDGDACYRLFKKPAEPAATSHADLNPDTATGSQDRPEAVKFLHSLRNFRII